MRKAAKSCDWSETFRLRKNSHRWESEGFGDFFGSIQKVSWRAPKNGSYDFALDWTTFKNVRKPSGSVRFRWWMIHSLTKPSDPRTPPGNFCACGVKFKPPGWELQSLSWLIHWSVETYNSLKDIGNCFQSYTRCSSHHATCIFKMSLRPFPKHPTEQHKQRSWDGVALESPPVVIPKGHVAFFRWRQHLGLLYKGTDIQGSDIKKWRNLFWNPVSLSSRKEFIPHSMT